MIASATRNVPIAKSTGPKPHSKVVVGNGGF
jgi:hypothetical protein